MEEVLETKEEQEGGQGRGRCNVTEGRSVGGR
jgi:hypothetical protein